LSVASLQQLLVSGGNQQQQQVWMATWALRLPRAVMSVEEASASSESDGVAEIDYLMQQDDDAHAEDEEDASEQKGAEEDSDDDEDEVEAEEAADRPQQADAPKTGARATARVVLGSGWTIILCFSTLCRSLIIWVCGKCYSFSFCLQTASTGLELLSLDARELQLSHHEMSRRLRAMRSMLTSPSEQGSEGASATLPTVAADGAASPTQDETAAGESLAQGKNSLSFNRFLFCLMESLSSWCLRSIDQSWKKMAMSRLQPPLPPKAVSHHLHQTPKAACRRPVRATCRPFVSTC
jgi:hypothetical protein